MTCFFPRDCWRSCRVNPETGKRPIVFSRHAGFSDMALQVPCGKCDGCLADRALSWALRCANEASLHQQNSFITLTYADEYLPKDGKIHKDHLQKFFKRARHEFNIKKYYACGEYGDISARPHYHAVVFGEDFREGKTVLINDELYSNNLLADVWGQGAVVCAPFAMAAACYVAGYVAKKIGRPDVFQLMSKGIGKEWIQRYVDDVRRTGVIVVDGREYPVPQRYLIWMEEELANVKQDRVNHAKKLEEEKGFFELDRERRAKERLQIQRVNERKWKGKI